MSISSRRGLQLAWFAALLIFSAGCRQIGLTVKNAWARPGAAGSNSAAYFEIHNNQGASDVLLSASSDVAQAIELHLSSMSQDGVMSMSPQEKLPLPDKETIRLEPGGLHMMLIGLTRELKVGDTFPLLLRFENAGELIVHVQVRDN